MGVARRRRAVVAARRGDNDRTHRLFDRPRLTATIRNDRRKQNALVRAGWDPLRFTWHDLDRHPANVLDEVRSTLATAA